MAEGNTARVPAAQPTGVDDPAIAVTSKSFWLAVQLLPCRFRRDVTRFYAWLRYVDDAVDRTPPERQLACLKRLRTELDAVYGGDPLPNRMLRYFRDVAQRYRIPIEYPRELLAGMEMDVVGTRYRTLDELNLYAFRVAGVVGLMLAHLMGVRDVAALKHAAHLGFGMQMTNICRDVVEDWTLGRRYIPSDLLDDAAAAVEPGDQPLSHEHRDAYAAALQFLLARGDAYYRSADEGIRALPWRCALAVRAARMIYAGSARVLQRRGYDIFAGRAALSPWRKLALAFRSLMTTAAETPGRIARAWRRRRAAIVAPVLDETVILRCDDVRDV